MVSSLLNPKSKTPDFYSDPPPPPHPQTSSTKHLVQSGQRLPLKGRWKEEAMRILNPEIML